MNVMPRACATAASSSFCQPPISPAFVPTLETTLGQMAPPKSGRVQECRLVLMLSPGWCTKGRREKLARCCQEMGGGAGGGAGSLVPPCRRAVTRACGCAERPCAPGCLFLRALPSSSRDSRRSRCEIRRSQSCAKGVEVMGAGLLAASFLRTKKRRLNSSICNAYAISCGVERSVRAARLVGY